MINAIEAKKLTRQSFERQQEYVEKYLSNNQNKFTTTKNKQLLGEELMLIYQ